MLKSTIKILLLSVSAICWQASCQTQFVETSDEPKAQKTVIGVEDEKFLRRPAVGSFGNIVVINDKQVPNEFYGPIYVGSDLVPLKIAYDTLSDWTMISKNNYDISSSDTKSAWVSPKGVPTTRDFRIGKYDTKGPIYNESMCLIHQKEADDKDQARLCVNDMPFVYAEVNMDQNSYQGVLGLARGAKNQINYVKLLQSQGIIERAIVSFNFEDPADKFLISQVAFGATLFSEVEGGKDGMNFYSNLGIEQWGLQIDDFLYNGEDMTNGQRAKIALIDSASSGIMLPQFVWDGILITMQHAALKEKRGYKIEKQKNSQDNYEIHVDRPCSDIWADLKPIEFKLENTTIEIMPRGYTYMIDENQGYCQIGLHPAKGETNAYRLGNIFLRNFYTSLDYDRDMIMIGVNRGAVTYASAKIEGHKSDPFQPKIRGNPMLAGFIMLGFIVFILVATVYFMLENKKLKEKKAKAVLDTHQLSNSELQYYKGQFSHVPPKKVKTDNEELEEDLIDDKEEIGSDAKPERFAIQSESIDESTEKTED